jgi:hypothetical protein
MKRRYPLTRIKPTRSRIANAVIIVAVHHAGRRASRRVPRPMASTPFGSADAAAGGGRRRSGAAMLGVRATSTRSFADGTSRFQRQRRPFGCALACISPSRAATRRRPVNAAALAPPTQAPELTRRARASRPWGPSGAGVVVLVRGTALVSNGDGASSVARAAGAGEVGMGPPGFGTPASRHRQPRGVAPGVCTVRSQLSFLRPATGEVIGYRLSLLRARLPYLLLLDARRHHERAVQIPFRTNPSGVRGRRLALATSGDFARARAFDLPRVLPMQPCSTSCLRSPPASGPTTRRSPL